MKKLAALLTLGVFLATSASAATFYLYGNNFNEITTTVNFGYNKSTGTVNIDLDNTSSIQAILTSFAFNVPTNITGVSSFSYSGDIGTWDFTFDPDSIDLPQSFGLFDVGAFTGNNMNGGDPKGGIYEGHAASFHLTFEGSGLNLLNTDSFLKLLSYEGKNNDYPVNFIARYQGVGPDREWSDVGVVPEPSTFVLLGMGIAGVAFLSRRKKSA